MEGHSPDAGEVRRVAEGEAGVELGRGSHVAFARREIDNVGFMIEQDAARCAGKGERMGVARGQGMLAGLETGVEVGRDRGRGEAGRRVAKGVRR